ncbi:MAG: DedA family protein [archaeon]
MLTEFVIGLVLPIIQNIGYFGVFLLMIAESTLLPIPSEAVLPFAGYLIAQGTMDFWITLIIATIGTIIGASISYFIGKFIGQAAIAKWGKYIFIQEEELDNAKEWFKAHGEKTIFICRFIPAIRHVISLPAGAADMHFKKFVLYTTAGGAMWNAILLIVGMQLKQNWNTLIQYSTILDAIVIGAVIIVIIWFFSKQIRKNNKTKKGK